MKYIDVTEDNQHNVSAMLQTGIPYKMIKIYEQKNTRVVYSVVKNEVRLSMSNFVRVITISEMNEPINEFLGVSIEDVLIHMSDSGIFHFRLKEKITSPLS